MSLAVSARRDAKLRADSSVGRAELLALGSAESLVILETDFGVSGRSLSEHAVKVVGTIAVSDALFGGVNETLVSVFRLARSSRISGTCASCAVQLVLVPVGDSVGSGLAVSARRDAKLRVDSSVGRAELLALGSAESLVILETDFGVSGRSLSEH